MKVIADFGDAKQPARPPDHEEKGLVVF